MKTKEMLPLEILRECFHLSDKSPSGLIWKTRPRNHFNTDHGHRTTNGKFSGKDAGTLLRSNLHSKLYWTVVISLVPYLAHRIVYSMFHDVEISVDLQIDHEDGNGLNNKTLNLRTTDYFGNTQNSPIRKDNTSGFKGVCWHKGSQRWLCQIQHNKQRRRIFSHSPEEAYRLGCELRESLHKEFCNHG